TAASCSTAMTQVACKAATAPNTNVGVLAVSVQPNTSYYVFISGSTSNDVTGTFTIGVNTVLSTRTELPGGEVSLYPNPSHSGTVQLRVSGITTTGTVEGSLFNSLGQRVLSQRWTVRAGVVEQPLPVQQLAKGVYSLQLQVGEYLLTRKLVID
ncbi:T9SS type A sorting domain-containing protein, partial [Hymenobacter sp. BT175]|uniref:T9SS type A sorting domain-containing protein n=1 Tax=Hymenobacter translucens TaxID=2886507 RepID=UPI001D0E1797